MGKILIFDAGQSYDPDGDALRYRWDFNNDGRWDTQWLRTPKIKHIYSCKYNGFVRLEVSDSVWKDDCILRIVTESNGSVDQKQEKEDGYVKIYGNNCYAQFFKPSVIGFDGIDLLIERKGIILPPLLKKFFPFLSKFLLGNLSIAIHGNLTGEKIAETSLSPGDVEGKLWIHINFSMKLKYNQTYYIVVHQNGGNEWQYYKWYYGNGNPYDRGKGYILQNKWKEIPNADFCFRTYGHRTGNEPDGVEQRWAVILGCFDTFVGLSYYADDDAYDIKETLVNHGWEEEHIKILISPTLNEIKAAMKWLDSMDDMDDVDMVVWTSHGSGDGFAAKDQEVRYEENMKPWLNQCDAHAIFIAADTCHAGGAILHLSKEGRVIMTSSKVSELSYSTPQLRNSIFTYYLADPEAGGIK